MSHKEHREQVRLLKSYKTGPAHARCNHADCCRKRGSVSRKPVQPEHRGHVCWMFKDDRCGCGRTMKRGLGYNFEIPEDSDDKAVRQVA